MNKTIEKLVSLCKQRTKEIKLFLRKEQALLRIEQAEKLEFLGDRILGFVISIVKSTSSFLNHLTCFLAYCHVLLMIVSKSASLLIPPSKKLTICSYPIEFNAGKSISFFS